MTRDEFHLELRNRIHRQLVMHGPVGNIVNTAAELFFELTQCRKCNGDGIRMLLGPGEHEEHERKPYDCQECDGTGSQLR